MRKLLIISLIIIGNINSFSQDVVGSRIIGKQAWFLKDNWVDSLRRDTLLWVNDFRTLPTAGAVYKFVAGRMSSGAGSGSVTSVGQTFTGGLISVSGSPITTSGTLALTVAGTSGGIPYFSSTSTWASSGLLAANSLMIGGGAGAAPSTTTTGTGVLTALGVNVGSAGAFVVNGGALGTPSSGTGTNITGIPEGGLSLTDITTNNTSTTQHGFFPKLTSNTVYYVSNAGALTALALGANGTVLTSNGPTSAPTFTSPAGGGLTVGTTTITSGTDKYALYNNAGVLGNYAAMQFGNTNNNVLITAQAATDVPLAIKGAGSQSGNYMNILTSADAPVLEVTSAGELHINNPSDKGAYWIQTTGGSALYGVDIASNSSLIEGNASSGSGNYFTIQNTGGSKWSIYAGGGMNLEFGTASTGIIQFSPTFTGKANIKQSGFYVGDNTTSASALLHLAAGTATAGTASLKINEGTRLTTPENGTINYVANNLEFTETATVYILAKTLTETGTLNFGNTAAGAATDLTITVNGAAVGDAVYIGTDNASVSATDNVSFWGWVSATNTVTIRFNNNNLVAAVDPASGTFRAVVVKY